MRCFPVRPSRLPRLREICAQLSADGDAAQAAGLAEVFGERTAVTGEIPGRALAAQECGACEGFAAPSIGRSIGRCGFLGHVTEQIVLRFLARQPANVDDDRVAVTQAIRPMPGPHGFVRDGILELRRREEQDVKVRIGVHLVTARRQAFFAATNIVATKAERLAMHQWIESLSHYPDAGAELVQRHGTDGQGHVEGHRLRRSVPQFGECLLETLAFVPHMRGPADGAKPMAASTSRAAAFQLTADPAQDPSSFGDRCSELEPFHDRILEKAEMARGLPALVFALLRIATGHAWRSMTTAASGNGPLGWVGWVRHDGTLLPIVPYLSKRPVSLGSADASHGTNGGGRLPSSPRSDRLLRVCAGMRRLPGPIPMWRDRAASRG